MNALIKSALGLLAAFVCSRHPAEAQLSAPEPQPIVGARMPALSPDGKRLAFVYRGDIWLATDKGGRAAPLTQHIEMDAYPLFSPDGRWVAFASRRNGNFDIFAIPAEGGAARQLTWHAGQEIPQGWSPDGKRLLFSGRRDTVHYTLYSIDVTTLRSEKLCEDYAPLNFPNCSSDGKKVVYGRYGFHWTRPRYRGSAAAEIWLFDMADQTRQCITSDGHQHLWTRFLPDNKRLVTVTCSEETPASSRLDEVLAKVRDNPQRTPNLWIYDLEGRGKQLTTFSGGAVRCPSVAAKSGDLAFEYGPDIWILRDRKKKPEKIKLFVAEDEKQNTRRRERSTSGVTEAEPSPDGKTFAFGLHGDIWTVAIDKPKGKEGRNAEFARRLTEWAGDDSDFSWSPDGKKLFFTSDRLFNTRPYQLELDSLKVKPLWDRDEDVTGLRLTPDGKQLSFWVTGKEGGLYALDLESGETRRVVKIPGPQWRGVGGGDFAWSPDMRWIAYSRRGANSAWNLWIVPAEGGEAINITQLYANHTEPAWSPDGKYLFFQSNREGEGLYVLPLTRELGRVAEGDLKFEKVTNQVHVAIEFEDIARRIRKVASQSPQSDLTVTPDGLLLFLSENDIWSVTYDGKETKRLTTGGGKSQFRVSSDGKKAFFVQNGELYTMNLDSKNAEKISFTAEWERDVNAERKAAFTEFWRDYHRGFYDANFHGRDWEAIRGRYESLLESVDTNEEFATLLHMMVGELETSHAEVTPASGGPAAPITPHLGFTFDYTYGGPGIRVAGVPEGSPAWFRKNRIHEGEYIISISGTNVNLDERLYQFINDKHDREFEFLVNTTPTAEGAHKVKYKPLTQEEWTELNYRNRIDHARKYVEDKSQRKIGYLHLPAMQANNQVKFEREAYEYIAGKDAMIIDVRFNTGGNISDTLIDWLERKPHGYFLPRDSEKEPSPRHSWEKPIIVLMNEHSYSNGEMFPYAMRARGLARLVGTTTPGYVIWTDSLKLVDGTGARMPQMGVYRLDGTPQENLGEKPDVVVPLPPDDWLAGRDPQLDKAIELLAPTKPEETEQPPTQP